MPWSYIRSLFEHLLSRFPTWGFINYESYSFVMLNIWIRLLPYEFYGISSWSGLTVKHSRETHVIERRCMDHSLWTIQYACLQTFFYDVTLITKTLNNNITESKRSDVTIQKTKQWSVCEYQPEYQKHNGAKNRKWTANGSKNERSACIDARMNV